MHWNEFYKCNKEKFFKDRSYIGREFPCLDPANREASASWKHCMELGCGVGNTIVPLFSAFPDRKFYVSDFAPSAVELLKVRIDSACMFFFSIFTFFLLHIAVSSSIQTRTMRCIRLWYHSRVPWAAWRSCWHHGHCYHDICIVCNRTWEDAGRSKACKTCK